ncbi:MAG: amino acid ABC transporter substrate-binding protein [Acidobacteriota bacterium]
MGWRVCRTAWAALVLMAGWPVQAVQPAVVVYPGDDFRYAEYIAVLRKALDETTSDFGPYVMRPASVSMNEPRFLFEARSGHLVNVVWSATSKEKEKTLRPIRVPLSKGILGYRILFIHESMQAQFAQVRSLKDLRRFRFCLGPGWGDVPIYRNAALHVDLAEYDSLLPMVEAGRCDAFSRGINEIFEESQRMPKALSHVAIERRLMLHYPYPFYLFVTPSEENLARRIETGVRRMLGDGAFEQIFSTYNAEWIRRAKVEQRLIIEMANPDLPPETPSEESGLWFVPRKAAAVRPPS